MLFKIRYQAINGTHETETFEGSRQQLVGYLAKFERPIVAVYEEVTVITKIIRTQLVSAARSGAVNLTTLSAKTFAMEGMRLTTPT